MSSTGGAADLPQTIHAALQPRTLLVVISGPSGVGKDATVKRMKARGLPFHFVVTVTTRPRRPDEVDGVDYRFVQPGEYQEMLQRGELLEHAEVYGNLYGIPRQAVEQALRRGEDVILRVDPLKGARTVKALMPEAVAIFLAPSSLEELLQRLRERKTETEEDFERRKLIALQELEVLPEFDYAVVNRNDRLDAAVEAIQAIILAEKCRLQRRPVRLEERPRP